MNAYSMFCGTLCIPANSALGTLCNPGAGTGYIKTDDMRKILHNVGLRLSYRQVKELCAYVAETTGNAVSSRSNRTDRIFYRQITDTNAGDV